MISIFHLMKKYPKSAKSPYFAFSHIFPIFKIPIFWIWGIWIWGKYGTKSPNPHSNKIPKSPFKSPFKSPSKSPFKQNPQIPIQNPHILRLGVLSNFIIFAMCSKHLTIHISRLTILSWTKCYKQFCCSMYICWDIFECFLAVEGSFCDFLWTNNSLTEHDTT